MLVDLKTAAEAAVHDWNTLPRWKRLEIEKETKAAYVLSHVRSIIMDEKKCAYCNGSGIVTSAIFNCIDECLVCVGTGKLEVHPTMTQVKELIQ